MTGGCQHVRANGTACRAVVGVNADGLCLAHTSDGASRMAEISRKGGQATAARFASVPFVAEDVPRIETLEDAKLALDNIRIAVLTRRITHAEGNAASKAVSEWCKAEGMAATGRLVTELRNELAAKTAEIATLRTTMQATTGAVRPRPFAPATS